MAGTVDSTGRGHPIGVGLSRIADELKTLRDHPAWSMNAAEARAALVEATRMVAQVSELEARIAHHAQTVEVEADSGATSTANWWAHATKQTRAVTHRKTKLATALGSEVFEPVRAALAEGRVLVDQARVIVAAIEALPDDLEDAIRVDAVATLVGYAAEFDAKALRTMGRRILATVAPEVGEAHEARVLEAEEREAEAAAVFRMVEDGQGKCHGRFTIPALHGAMLRKALLAYAAPKHRTSVDGQAPAPGRPSAHKLGEAFLDYLETSHRPAPARRRRQRHGRGDHDPGDAVGWAEGRPAGHRPPHLSRPRAETGLSGRDHPRRPRHPVPGPRPGSEGPVPHRTPTHRTRDRATRLHRRGLRLATRHVPRGPTPISRTRA